MRGVGHEFADRNENLGFEREVLQHRRLGW